MFKITLSPLASLADDQPPTVLNDTITYQGSTYDLAQLQDGAEIEIGGPFVGHATRVNGVIHCTLRYRYNFQTSLPDQPATWDAYTFEVAAGQCTCPILRLPISDVEQEAGLDE